MKKLKTIKHIWQNAFSRVYIAGTVFMLYGVKVFLDKVIRLKQIMIIIKGPLVNI